MVQTEQVIQKTNGLSDVCGTLKRNLLSLIVSGRAFHNLGEEVEKALNQTFWEGSVFQQHFKPVGMVAMMSEGVPYSVKVCICMQKWSHMHIKDPVVQVRVCLVRAIHLNE